MNQQATEQPLQFELPALSLHLPAGQAEHWGPPDWARFEARLRSGLQQALARNLDGIAPPPAAGRQAWLAERVEQALQAAVAQALAPGSHGHLPGVR